MNPWKDKKYQVPVAYIETECSLDEFLETDITDYIEKQMGMVVSKPVDTYMERELLDQVDYLLNHLMILPQGIISKLEELEQYWYLLV
jgi:hypothetical protein